MLQPRAVLLWFFIAIVITATLVLSPRKASDKDDGEVVIKAVETKETRVDAAAIRTFLESKQSPLAPDTEFVLELKHWKLLIAISAIESQYCKRQLGYNCWGIGGDSAYRHYSSYRAAAQDANDLIERWQKKGRWLTVEDMNCSYVVPCSPNWVKVVNQNLDLLNGLK